MTNNDTIENITDEEQQLLDLLESGKELSDKQLESVMANEQLTADYLMVRQAAAALEAQSLDVDARLKQMKRQRRRGTRKYALWSAIAAAAAAVACLFVLWPTAKEAAPQHSSANHIFTADNSKPGITIVDEGRNRTVAAAEQKTKRADTEIDVGDLLAECEAEERVTINVPTGKSAHLTLPDGSQVWLYPGSRLKFPHRFVGDTREVLLEGRAYFSVERDAGHPFVVTASDITTTVLGTEFVVSAYEATTPQVTLVSGSVEIAKGGRKALLKPGSQATATADGGFAIGEVDTEPYVQWRDGYFYFDNASLHDILVAIGRSYNVCVVCRRPELLTQRMRFIADRNASLKSIVSRLNEIADTKVRLNGNTIEL